MALNFLFVTAAVVIARVVIIFVLNNFVFLKRFLRLTRLHLLVSIWNWKVFAKLIIWEILCWSYFAVLWEDLLVVHEISVLKLQNLCALLVLHRGNLPYFVYVGFVFHLLIIH